MPLYEYECEACGKRFEKIQKFSDPPADVCAHCGQGPVKKLLSSPAIQFKGSGWYITDYARKGKESKGAKESKDGKESKDSKDTTDAKESTTSSTSSTETKPSATSTEKKD